VLLGSVIKCRSMTMNCACKRPPKRTQRTLYLGNTIGWSALPRGVSAVIVLPAGVGPESYVCLASVFIASFLYDLIGVTPF
jgi:hypothetical protein